MPDRKGNVAQIKAELSPSRVKEGEWNHWWQETRRMVAESACFGRNGSGPITLLARPPSPPAKKSDQASSADPPKAQGEQLRWFQWFQGEGDDVPSKSGNPVKAAYDALDDCPPEAHRTALRRTMSAAGRFLSADKRPKAAATKWARLVEPYCGAPAQPPQRR